MSDKARRYHSIMQGDRHEFVCMCGEYFDVRSEAAAHIEKWKWPICPACKKVVTVSWENHEEDCAGSTNWRKREINRER